MTMPEGPIFLSKWMSSARNQATRNHAACSLDFPMLSSGSLKAAVIRNPAATVYIPSCGEMICIPLDFARIAGGRRLRSETRFQIRK